MKLFFKSLCTACVPLPPKLLNVTCQLYLETVTDSTGDNKCLMLKFFILFCSVFLQEPLKFNPMWEKQSTKLMYDAIYSERLFRSNQGVVCFFMFCQKGETYQPNYYFRTLIHFLAKRQNEKIITTFCLSLSYGAKARS